MYYGIFSHKSLKRSIAERVPLLLIMARGVLKRKKNVLFKELNNNFVVINLARNGIYPFEHIIHSNQYWFPNALGKGLIKSMPQTSKSSIFRNWVEGHHILF